MRLYISQMTCLVPPPRLPVLSKKAPAEATYKDLSELATLMCFLILRARSADPELVE
jgi:hypothetical protein